MPTYTVFFLDQEDKTAAVSEVECPDDHNALTTAATLKGDHYDVEGLDLPRFRGGMRALRAIFRLAC
jgi:hypothetical protein